MSSTLSIRIRSWARTLLGVVAVIIGLSTFSAQAQQVVISQIYGGGGNAGATFNRDFVELHNRGATSVDVTGWSVQMASSTGSSWSRRDISGTIAAGGYFLIHLTTGTGTVGAPLPTADQSTGTILDISATSGKLALLSNQVTIPVQHTVVQGTLGLVDLVGYGQANIATTSTSTPTGGAGFEGRNSAPILTNTTAAIRANNGCQQTHDNLVDFAAGLPVPRNSASAPVVCVGMGACCTGSGGIYTTSAACSGTYQGDFSTLGGVTYTATTGTNAFDDISTTGLLLPLDNADDVGVNLNLAIPFLHYGQPRYSISVGSNGLITGLPGSAAAGRTNTVLPLTTASNDSIAPLWMDMFVRTTLIPTAHVYIQQKTSPNRLVVQWNKVSTFNSGTLTPDNLTFEAILYQETGAVEYRYGAMNTTGTSATATETIGVENQSGTVGTQVAAVAFASLTNTSILLTPVNGAPCGPTAPPAALGAASPNPVLQGGTTVLTATVTPAIGSTGLSVVGNLTLVGGSASATFLDDGLGADAVANDNIFTFQYNVPGAQAPGVFTLPLTITDAQGRLGSSFIQLQVTVPPPPNDTCATAIALTLDIPVLGTTSGANNDYQLPAASPAYTGVGQVANTAPGADVAYSFTAPSAGLYSFRVTNYSLTQNPVIYTASGCTAGAPPITIANAILAANRGTTNGAEEVFCENMAAGEQVFVFVDNAVAANLGSTFVVEVNSCVPEVEPNGTPATATAYVFPMEGSASVTSDNDFYSIGTPPAGSRVFAMIDAIQTPNADLDMRVTTTVDTLQYDDWSTDLAFGINNFAPEIMGRQLTGVPSYIEVNAFTTSVLTEPYRLYAVVRPPSTSAVPEVEGNDTFATANNIGNYISGALATATDVDTFAFTATAGQIIFLGLDVDPTRDLTPFNGALALLDSAGANLLVINDTSATTSDNTTGAGSLTATTPNSASEGLVFRARTTGTYYAKVSGAAAGDYLLSIHTQATPDLDGDNVADSLDNCPGLANSNQLNSDSDAFGDACDNCPTVANNAQVDGDTDTVGDACDNCVAISNLSQVNADADNFGDVCDNCPLVPNNFQTDADVDTVGDACDNCPGDVNPGQQNGDGDFFGDLCDNCPAVPNNLQENGDGDNNGDACDNCPTITNVGQANADGDLNGDACDNCVTVPNNGQANLDGDVFGDACDNCPSVGNNGQANADGDLNGDLCDNCPTVSNNGQANADGDLNGDACDNCVTVPNNGQANVDGDTNGDACDNCPTVSNNGQANADGDLNGDACDNCVTVPNNGQANGDGDNFGDVCDNCPAVPNNTQANADGDSAGDACDGCQTDPLKLAPGQCGCGVADTDGDGDTIANCVDNCPTIANAGQQDADNDNRGDACDNCPTTFNPTQADCDGNFVGDACEIAAGSPDCNMNGIPDTCDISSLTSPDANTNGIPDECELNGGTPYCFGYTGCPCSNNSTPGSGEGCKNTSGAGAKLTGSGLTSVFLDSLVLNVTGLPLPPLGAGRLLFFQGTGQANSVFDEGIRCVSGTQVRIGSKTHISGTSSYPQMGDLPVSVKGGVGPAGGVRNYQVLYRNFPGLCVPSSNANLSNGLSVVWVP